MLRHPHFGKDFDLGALLLLPLPLPVLLLFPLGLLLLLLLLPLLVNPFDHGTVLALELPHHLP